MDSLVAVLIVATPPDFFELVFVPAPRGEVKETVNPHQGLRATRVGGVRVVDSAVLEREGAHALLLRLGLVDVLVVVVGAVFLLLFGEGGAEVVFEVAAKG